MTGPIGLQEAIFLLGRMCSLIPYFFGSVGPNRFNGRLLGTMGPLGLIGQTGPIIDPLGPVNMLGPMRLMSPLAVRFNGSVGSNRFRDRLVGSN